MTYMERWSDCHCEDYPACGHFDTSPPVPDYCNICGYAFVDSCPCDEEEEEDADD